MSVIDASSVRFTVPRSATHRQKRENVLGWNLLLAPHDFLDVRSRESVSCLWNR